MTDIDYNWRTYRVAKARQSDNDGLTRPTPEQMDHATLSVEIPTDGLSYPRLNWIGEQAKRAEREFIEVARAMGLDPSETVSQYPHLPHKWDERDCVGPNKVIYTHDLDGDEKRKLKGEAERIEDEFLATVRDAIHG